MTELNTDSQGSLAKLNACEPPLAIDTTEAVEVPVPPTPPMPVPTSAPIPAPVPEPGPPTPPMPVPHVHAKVIGGNDGTSPERT